MSAIRRQTLSLPGRISGVAASPVIKAPEPPPVPPVDHGAAWKSFEHSLASAIAEVKAWRRDAAKELSRRAVSLATAIAEKLLASEIVADRQRLDRIVERALESAQASRPIIVRGHPDDLSLLRRQLDANSPLGGPDGDMLLRVDPALIRGRLKIETDDWFLELDTARSLTELETILKEAVDADK